MQQSANACQHTHEEHISTRRRAADLSSRRRRTNKETRRGYLPRDDGKQREPHERRGEAKDAELQRGGGGATDVVVAAADEG